MKILNPRYETSKTTVKTIQHLDFLKGKTIAFLDNGWPSTSYIFNKLDILLREDHEVFNTFTQSIPMSEAAHQHLLDYIATKCEAAIVGLGN